MDPLACAVHTARISESWRVDTIRIGAPADPARAVVDSDKEECTSNLSSLVPSMRCVLATSLRACVERGGRSAWRTSKLLRKEMPERVEGKKQRDWMERPSLFRITLVTKSVSLYDTGVTRAAAAAEEEEDEGRGGGGEREGAAALLLAAVLPVLIKALGLRFGL